MHGIIVFEPFHCQIDGGTAPVSVAQVDREQDALLLEQIELRYQEYYPPFFPPTSRLVSLTFLVHRRTRSYPSLASVE